jgi:hypothetical protein
MLSRIQREKSTIIKMIDLYCHNVHGGESTCLDCQALSEYAQIRLQKCPFQEGKTTCAKCPVHCYKADRREEIRKVMRYAGPRMLLRYPIQSIFHLLDGLRKRPSKI